MDGGDDLGVVDPAEVSGGDGQVGMPELCLDHEQRDPLAGRLHRMRVPELVRREPASDSCYRGGVVQLSADSGRSAWPPACRAAQDAEQRPTGRSLRSSSQGSRCIPAQRSIPTSRRLSPLPWRTTSEPRPGSRSVSLRASASLIRRPARQSTTMIARSRRRRSCRRRRASPRRSPRPSAGPAGTEAPCFSVRVPRGSWTLSLTINCRHRRITAS
jgi:hypothetical protein